MAVKSEYKPLIPQGFVGEPTDIVDVLKRAYAVIEEEGRWVTSTWYRNPHQEVNPEDPFCNSWSVCAEGAVGLVTIGAYRELREDHNSKWCFLIPGQQECPLYHKANELLTEAGKIVWPGTSFVEANAFNDCRCKTRTQALAWFKVAIAIGEARQAVRFA